MMTGKYFVMYMGSDFRERFIGLDYEHRDYVVSHPAEKLCSSCFLPCCFTLLCRLSIDLPVL